MLAGRASCKPELLARLHGHARFRLPVPLGRLQVQPAHEHLNPYGPSPGVRSYLGCFTEYDLPGNRFVSTGRGDSHLG